TPEKQIPGAAVCLENANVYNAFSTAAANFIEIMNISIILILISLNCCTAQVATCKDDADNNPPNVVSSSIMKSEGNPAWAPSAQNVDRNRDHSIVRTMANFIANNINIKVLAYSDDPPNLPPRNEKSKAKGVLLVDNRANDAAAWFVHTVPNFLAYLGGYSWPPTETAKGHMFLCLSLSEAHLNSVAKAVRYQEPYIYVNNLTPALLNQHIELSNLATGVEIRLTPFLEHAKFTTKGVRAAANIQAFGKHTKSFADIYSRILRSKLSASIRIWAPYDAKSKSICKGQHKLRKIASPMQFAGNQVSREVDSTNWALVDGKNTVCLTTNDYKKQLPSWFCSKVALHRLQLAKMIIMSFVYKPPNEISTKVMKSGPDPAWGNSVRSINNAQHSIGRTMVDFVRNTPQIKVLAYNNDPPNLPPGKETSKAKGVLLVDNTVTDAAAWFIHTAPNFLAHLGGYTWPAAETAKGHMFLCLSLNEIHLNSVAKALRYQEPYIYANNLPVAILNQHEELSNLVNGIEVRVTPFLEHARFVTKRTQVEANVQVFGKHTKSFSDIYGRVLRNKLSASIRIWAHSDARSKSICKGQHKLRKIASPMQFADSEVSREADSTRWALVEGKNTVCLTTNDYKSGLNPAWAPSAQPIQSNNGHSIVQTMAHFVADNPNIKVLAYSDDPPNLPPRNEKSKAKGVLLIDNSAANAAAWLVHTVPKFLSHLGGYSWPQTETAKGHIFLCLSINEESLNAVARAVRYQEPYIYANNLPLALLNQHNELSNLATGVEIRVTPFLEHAKLATRNNGANVQAFGKHTKSFADMYERVLRNKLSAKIRIWAPSDTRSKSICKGQYHLRKIVSPMQFDGVQVSREADSAKWALVEGKNTVCFTTNDYKATEKQIPGAAVCLENANVYNAFTANPVWTRSAQAIDQGRGHSVFTTMASFIADHMNIKVLAYSDDPPNLPPRNEKSKAKVDSTVTDAAAWFVHTVPNFLAHLGGYSWPPAETTKGHIFLCVSFIEAHLNSVAKAIRYQEPYIYANNLSPALLNQHNELSNLATGVEIRITPFLEHAKFTTKAAQVAANIQAFGKHSKSFADMYARVLRNRLSANIRIWAPSDARSKSICKGQYQLRKIASPMQFDGVQVSREADSAKWALVEGKNTVCFTTNDYKMSEKQIPGAAVCLENAGVLLIDHTGNDAAAWFVHTVPNFLAHLGGYSWPPAETAKGHMFLCVSFTEVHLNSVAKAIRYQEPYIYANNLSPPLLNQHRELSNLVNGVEIRVTPFLDHSKFITKREQVAANIQAFGKHRKSFADMYAKILRSKLSASIRIWAPSDTRSKSICKGQYHLRKIVSPMQFDGVQVSREADSAKWAWVEGKNTVCFTTNDYKMNEKQIPGAAVCLENAGVLLIDHTGNDAAAWFVHTVPNFLAHLGGYSWPPAETAKGHMFLCVSFTEVHLNSVAKAIRYQEPYIYANNLSPPLLNQHEELSNLVNGVEVRVTPFLDHSKFITKREQVAANIQAFGKHRKSFADMYAKILRSKLSASIRIWAPSDKRSKSICKGQYHLRKIASPMQFDGVQVSREADSAKWALVEGKNIVCLTTNDYKLIIQQMQLRGLCTPRLIFLHISVVILGLNQKLPKDTCFCVYRKAIRHQEPYIYANNLPVAILNQYMELSNLVNGVDARITPFLEHAKFTTKAVHAVANIQAFGKHSKSFADMYARILRKKFSASIRIWAPSDARSKSICNGQYQLRKIVSPMQLAVNNANINVLAYSDDPPNLPPRNEKSKAKGVLLVDNRVNDAAAWFVHTVPNFLAYLGGYSWPAAETANGHMFLCLSLNEAHLNSVAKAIRYQEPYIYANNMPAAILSQHIELSNLATGVEIRITPFLEHAKFVTKAAQAAANIQAFGKHTKSFADIYAKVLRNKLSASIRIWAPSDARSKSICKGQYQLRKVASPMQLADSQVSREADSTRWALVEGKNTVCFTTNDYKMNEKQIPGAAVCLENAGVLLVDNVADAAAWFVHTAPNFLAHLGGYSWPPAETAKGHMFLCISINKAHLNLVGKAIRHQEPYIYANNLPAAILNQYMELSNLVNGVDVRITPFLEHAQFMTKGVQAAANIQAFGKHSKSFADMYARILRKKFSASIRIWAPSDARSKSICNRQYQLRKITSPMQLDGVQVSREADSAKWALIDGKNTVCFTTNDYKATEKQTPGAAVCLENAGVYNAFRTAAINPFGFPIFSLLMMLTAGILIFISLKTCIAQVATCKDDGNVNPPNALSSKLLKSALNPAWAPSGANIDRNAGHSIIRTMANFVQHHAQINVLAYSDDPPNLPPRNEKSKTKGVLLVDNRDDAAAWFVHTVPNFLAYLSAYSWPATETPKGHMFLCVSFSKVHLNSVGKAIRHQEPYIYANNLPVAILNQYMELSNLVNGVDVRVTPFLGHEKFVTKREQVETNIQAFGKHTKSFADMYAKILRSKLSASIRIWAPSDKRSKSICKGQYHLRKIVSPMQLDGVQVSRESDSAKWALIEGKNTVCFTTNDYKTPEKQIPGAAVCLENANPPNVVSSSIIKSEANPVWAPSAQNVNHDREHSIVRTIAHFIANNGDIKVLAYSDDPPNLPPRNEKSKAKGVLLVDNTGTDAAAWFVHTVPNFLAHLGGYSWPAAETAKGHMFLCLSLNEAHLNSVAKAIRYQEPFIYANNLSPALLTQHNELSNLATGAEIRVTPFLEHAKFTTKAAVRAAANIQAIGKHTKSFADMYAKVLKNKLAASIRIWAPSDTRSKSICKGQYHLRKIVSPMQLAGNQVSREADSAKWALVEGKNIVCLTTNDYKVLCIQTSKCFTNKNYAITRKASLGPFGANY
ncbi:Deoxyribonuclease-2-alpha, partial [Trichinella papuae]